MKNKVGWIVAGSLIVVFGLFFVVATTIMAPESQLVSSIEHFLNAHGFQEVSKTEDVTTQNGRPVVDTLYEIDVAAESDAWDVKARFHQVCERLDDSEVWEDGKMLYRAPRGFRQIAELEWTGPTYDNSTWPHKITVRIRRYTDL